MTPSGTTKQTKEPDQGRDGGGSLEGESMDESSRFNAGGK